VFNSFLPVPALFVFGWSSYENLFLSESFPPAPPFEGKASNTPWILTFFLLFYLHKCTPNGPDDYDQAVSPLSGFPPPFFPHIFPQYCSNILVLMSHPSPQTLPGFASQFVIVNSRKEHFISSLISPHFHLDTYAICPSFYNPFVFPPWMCIQTSFYIFSAPVQEVGYAQPPFPDLGFALPLGYRARLFFILTFFLHHPHAQCCFLHCSPLCPHPPLFFPAGVHLELPNF